MPRNRSCSTRSTEHDTDGVAATQALRTVLSLRSLFTHSSPLKTSSRAVSGATGGLSARVFAAASICTGGRAASGTLRQQADRTRIETATFIRVLRQRSPVAWLGFIVAAALGLSVCLQTLAQSDAQPQRYALLVGCTEYRNCDRIPELWGPANDVPMFAELLATVFGFDLQNMTQLTGWPDEESSRPTHDNIVAAFEDLIGKSQPDTQIVILMSGHGTQIPIPEEQQDATDPANPEPDGMDEVFLPADVRGWEEDGLGRAIRDDQVGRWLDEMKSRGAAVWIVFDCCHSGTMTRGGHEREVHPFQLGIPEDQWARARAKAAPQERTRSIGSVEEGTLDTLQRSPDGGSVVAFYAAQSFEKAPELPRPSDAQRTRENYFGLLSYNLTRALRQRAARDDASGITYRELGRLLIAEYRAERGSRGPTPFFHGDLDREVLGTRSFTGSIPIFLERSKRSFQVNAGELAGLTVGTILAIDPPGGDESAPVGHAVITKTTPATATVEACEFDGQAAVDLSDLPDACRCRIVQRDLGDMRVKLFVSADGTDDAQAARDALEKALESVPEHVAALFAVVESEDTADWTALAVGTSTAKANHRLDVDGPTVLLLSPSRQPAGPNDAGDPVASHEHVLAYPAPSADALIGPLSRDLQRIFTWQNVWRISGGLDGEGASEKNAYYRLEVTRTGADDGESSSTQQSQLRPGDGIEIVVENTGREDLWVTILFLAGNFEVAEWWSGALESGKSFEDSGTVDGSSSGTEGFVVLAVPIRAHKHQPDYSYLEQSGLGVGSRDVRRPPEGPQTPFENLMAAAAFGRKTRAVRRNVPSTPQITAYSWYTLPPEQELSENR